MSKPTTWEVSTSEKVKEYDFGDGVFGQRFKGNITAAANTRLNTLISDKINSQNTNIIEVGGYAVTSDSNIKTTISNNVYGLYNSATVIAQYFYLYTNTEGLRLINRTEGVRTNSPFDVWVLYTKTTT